jgi:hypothetical protein
MPRFQIAHVRFSSDGQTYPVNCDMPYLKAGTKVMVRMFSTDNSLVEAEIVKTDESRGPCKNGVACRASEAAEYANGSFGVHDRASLEVFLKKRNFWNFMPLFYERHGVELSKEEWPVAYIQLPYNISPADSDEVLSRPYKPMQILLLGADSLAFVQHFGSVEFKDGNPIFTHLTYLDKFKVDTNRYRAAARLLEGDLTLDIDEDGGASLSDIRSAINGGDGGPAYLSDGVWI